MIAFSDALPRSVSIGLSSSRFSITFCFLHRRRISSLSLSALAVVSFTFFDALPSAMLSFIFRYLI
jgi:hypothetical protein